MAWQPDTKWERKEFPLTIDEVKQKHEKHPWQPMADFIACYKDGDELTRVEEGNNNRGAEYYLGTRMEGGRPTGFKYSLVVASYMS
jgi:hypothetical protein